MSRWLSNKDAVLRSGKITFQVIIRPEDPLFPWAAGLPWGAFPRLVKELLEWADARGMLTEHGLDLGESETVRTIPTPPLGGGVDLTPGVSTRAAAALPERDADPEQGSPFIIRRYQSP